MLGLHICEQCLVDDKHINELNGFKPNAWIRKDFLKSIFDGVTDFLAVCHDVFDLNVSNDITDDGGGLLNQVVVCGSWFLLAQRVGKCFVCCVRALSFTIDAPHNHALKLNLLHFFCHNIHTELFLVSLWTKRDAHIEWATVCVKTNSNLRWFTTAKNQHPFVRFSNDTQGLHEIVQRVCSKANNSNYHQLNC